MEFILIVFVSRIKETMICISIDAAGFGSIQVIRQPVFGFLGHPIEINKRAARLFSTLEYVTMCRNENFGFVFVRGEILLTYMIFVYHWTS